MSANHNSSVCSTKPGPVFKPPADAAAWPRTVLPIRSDEAARQELGANGNTSNGKCRQGSEIRRQCHFSAECFAAFYDSVPVGYATLDRSGAIRHINLTGAKLLGLAREQLVNLPLLNFVARLDQRKLRRHLATLQKGAGPLAAELHFQRPDKRVLLLQLLSRSTADTRDSLGPVFMVLTDVTAWRQAQIELAESREQFASLLNTAAEASITVDASRRILFLNAAAEAMFRCRADRIIGQALARLIPEPRSVAPEPRRRRSLRNGARARQRSEAGELRGRRADGEEFPIETNFSPVTLDGRRCVTITLRDISERKRAEADLRLASGLLAKANRSLEIRVREGVAEMLAINTALQHEIAGRRRLQLQLLEISEREQQRIGQDLHDGVGQQLTGITLLNDTLLEKLVHNSRPEQAEARRSAELLAQARIQVQQLSRGLHPVPVEPQGLMAALGQMAQTISALHRLECRFRCADAVRLHDNVKATHLFRIAQEAVHNAVRHGHCRHILITLAARQGSICLAVRDDGRGIRAQKVRTGGLGLQIMQSRCEAVAGTLTIRPVRPHGLLVECRMPSSPALAAPAKN